MEFLTEVLFWGAVVFLGIFFAFLRDNEIRTFTKKYYGPPEIPVIGSLYELAGNRVDRTQRFFFDWPKNYGPRYSFKLVDNHFFSSTIPEDVEKLMTSNVNVYKGKWYEFLGTLVYGLVGLGGAAWQKRRKMVNPSFHIPILKGFQKTFDEQSKILVGIWKKDHTNGKTFNICPSISRCTLDVICETAMGTRIGSQHNPEHKFPKYIDLAMRLIHSRILKPWLHPDFIWTRSPQGKTFAKIFDYISNFRNEIIAAKRAELAEEANKRMSNGVKEMTVEDEEVYMSKKKSVAFLDLILAARDDEGNGMSDHDLGCEVDTFIAAGQDTTAHATSWCLFNLAANPDVQEKVIEEMDEIFGTDTEREVTSEDLARMQYLEMCTKESLRIRPSVHFVIRQLLEEIKLNDGVVVPKGVNYLVHILSLHNDPKVYPEPHKFIPERFTPENCKTRSFYSYIPFSAGPRNCIGQKYAILEEKTLLANIFRNFRVTTKDKLEEIPVTMDITMRATNGLHLTLHPRFPTDEPFLLL